MRKHYKKRYKKDLIKKSIYFIIIKNYVNYLSTHTLLEQTLKIDETKKDLI